MKYFHKIGDIDPIPLMQQVVQNPHLWNQKTTRTFHPQSALRNIDDILLRYNDFNEGDDFVERVCSELECVNLPPFTLLTHAQQIIFGLMSRLAGERLGRCFISRLAPGGAIPPHTDRIVQAEEAFPDKIPPALYYSRFQICLQAQPGVIFRVGDEQLYMRPGEIWWFNHQVDHEVLNHSPDDRIAMVVDIRTFTPCR